MVFDGQRETVQILNPRITAIAPRAAPRQGVGIRLPEPLPLLHIAHGTLGNLIIFGQGIGRGHSCGSKDMLADVVVITLAADLFDDDAEQDKTVIAVFPARAGFKSESAVLVEFHIVLKSAKLKAMSVEIGAEDVAGATGVGEQAFDGHFGSYVLVRVIRQEFPERI